MAWFLLGGHFSNGGPDNVNQALIKFADRKILYIKSNNKPVRVLEIFWKILISEGIVVSGVCAKRYYDFMKVFHKKFVYLMHGCMDFENEINRLHLMNSYPIDWERLYLKKSETAQRYSKPRTTIK